MYDVIIYWRNKFFLSFLKSYKYADNNDKGSFCNFLGICSFLGKMAEIFYFNDL